MSKLSIVWNCLKISISDLRDNEICIQNRCDVVEQSKNQDRGCAIYVAESPDLKDPTVPGANQCHHKRRQR